MQNNIKFYLKYINKDFVKIILTNVLYTPIKINLLSTIRLVSKYNKVFEDVNLKVYRTYLEQYNLQIYRYKK